MNKIFLSLIGCCVALQLMAAESPGGVEWMTDFAKAQAKAKAEKKLLLMDFNGSDWCPPCKALRKEVFSSPEFAAFAKNNLVLLDVDFPRFKELPAAQATANEKLGQEYKIEAFPTVIVLDGDGKKLSVEQGYGGTKAKEYIAKLQKLKGK